MVPVVFGSVLNVCVLFPGASVTVPMVYMVPDGAYTVSDIVDSVGSEAAW